MTLASKLAATLVERYPERAASVLERCPAEEIAAVLAQTDAAPAANLLCRLSPEQARSLVASLPIERTAAFVNGLELDAAALLARRLDETTRQRVLEHLAPERAASLRTLLQFPPYTAGALMDPEVLAIPEFLTAREALARVREHPERARYNVYAIDTDHRLVGALNLRELMLAPPDVCLVERMRRNPHRIEAGADRTTVLSHPGWHDVHALPVVDENGHLLGAIRYRTLRQIEDELLHSQREDESVAGALGSLFATGAAGLLDAITHPAGGGPSRGR